MLRRARAIGLSLYVALTGGCYRWEVIRPTELPKLNGSSQTLVGTSGHTYAALATIAHVERPDGTMAEIKGRFDARVTVAGQTQEFEHPVDAALEGGDLKVRSSSRPPAAIPLQRIERLEVSQYDNTKTILFITGMSLVLFLGFTTVALVAID
jgi:hypothetical protein